MKYCGDPGFIDRTDRILSYEIPFSIEECFAEDINGAIQYLTRINQQMIDGGYKSAKVRVFDVEASDGWGTAGYSFELHGVRKETEKERAYRLENYEDELQGIKNRKILEEQRKVKEAEDRRKLYEQLKQEFEKED